MFFRLPLWLICLLKMKLKDKYANLNKDIIKGYLTELENIQSALPSSSFVDHIINKAIQKEIDACRVLLQFCACRMTV